MAAYIQFSSLVVIPIERSGRDRRVLCIGSKIEEVAVAKSPVKMTCTEKLTRALSDIETVIHKQETTTMRDALYDYVYSKLEQIEERTSHGKNEKVYR